MLKLQSAFSHNHLLNFRSFGTGDRMESDGREVAKPKGLCLFGMACGGKRRKEPMILFTCS
jgi:hypothetical protein